MPGIFSSILKEICQSTHKYARLVFVSFNFVEQAAADNDNDSMCCLWEKELAKNFFLKLLLYQETSCRYFSALPNYVLIQHFESEVQSEHN